MAEKRKSSKKKPNVEVVKVGSTSYVLFRPSDIYPGLRDKQALHIGNLDPNYKVFTPTPAYFELTKDLKEGIIFPSDWTLKNVELSNLSVIVKPSEKVSAQDKAKQQKAKAKENGPLAPELKTIASQINNNYNSRIHFGSTWLLYQVALKLGIIEDLVKVFGSNAQGKEKANRIFSLACFTLMESDSFDETEMWQEDNFLLTRALLDEEGVVNIFSSVTEKDCEDFMRLRKERIPKDKDNVEYLCVQTTTFISESSHWDKYGMLIFEGEKEYEDVVLYAYQNSQGKPLNGYYFSEKIPFYYDEFPIQRFVSKNRTANLLKVIEKIPPEDLDRLFLITDCGDDALSDLDPIISLGIKLQTKADPRQEDIKRIIKEDFPQPDFFSQETPSLFNTSYEQSYYQERTTLKINNSETGKECESEVGVTITVKLEPAAQEDVIRLFSTDLEKQTDLAQKEIDKKVPVSQRESFEKDFDLLKFDYDTQTQEITGFTSNQDKMEREILVAGFEAFRTIGIDVSSTDVELLSTEYCFQEQKFSEFKGEFGNTRGLDGEKETEQGQRLARFIALILSTYIELMMEENDLYKVGVDPRDLLKNLNQIYAIDRVNQIYLTGKNLARYKKILESMGGELPSGVRLQTTK